MKLHQQDATDREVLARVDRMSSDELADFDRLRPVDLRHYLREQTPWLEDEIYFLGIELRRAPTEDEIACCVLSQRHSQRFRAYYALRFPEAVALADN